MAYDARDDKYTATFTTPTEPGPATKIPVNADTVSSCFTINAELDHAHCSRCNFLEPIRSETKQGGNYRCPRCRCTRWSRWDGATVTAYRKEAENNPDSRWRHAWNVDYDDWDW